MFGKSVSVLWLWVGLSITPSMGFSESVAQGSPAVEERLSLSIPSSGLFDLSTAWKEENRKSSLDSDGNNTIDARDLIDAINNVRISRRKSPLIATALIPSGTFLMGNSGSARDMEYSFSGEFPRHTVSIRNPIEVGVYEITNLQYAEALNRAFEEGLLRTSEGSLYSGGDVYLNGRRLIVVTNPYCDVLFQDGRFVPRIREKIDQSDHPVCFVTWYGAIAFCNWLSEDQRLPPCYDLVSWTLTDPNAGGYRLPSEAEWEYACRGPASNPNRYAPFSFGDDPDLKLNTCDRSPLLDEFMVSCSSSNDWSEVVGIHRPNPYGLHDIYGNLHEWCQDAWHETYQGAPVDEVAWQIPASNFRVVRGGSWTYRPQQCRSASRDFNLPDKGDFFIGFRVVRTP